MISNAVPTDNIRPNFNGENQMDGDFIAQYLLLALPPNIPANNYNHHYDDDKQKNNIHRRPRENESQRSKPSNQSGMHPHERQNKGPSRRENR